jgi:hypothetical protein
VVLAALSCCYWTIGRERVRCAIVSRQVLSSSVADEWDEGRTTGRLSGTESATPSAARPHVNSHVDESASIEVIRLRPGYRLVVALHV